MLNIGVSMVLSNVESKKAQHRNHPLNSHHQRKSKRDRNENAKKKKRIKRCARCNAVLMV